MSADLSVMEVGNEPPPLHPTKQRVHKNNKPRQVSRFGVLNAFLDVTLRSLKPAAAAVWLLLFRDTKPEGLARTSQADLARRAGVNVRTVRRAISDLGRRGLLTVVRRGSLKSGLSIYRVQPLASPS